MASVTVRVDDETKEAAAAIAEDFGFDLSSVTRAFYRQMIRENRIPLNLSYGEPNDASLKALAESKRMFEEDKARFETPEQMFDALRI
ncbi:MAG: type II toxin-antitoxin system RelB/DinJ family antitoxin [Actinomycetaceae bacterium]|nr:type II toxin-antitoxin system RelB/DinJ family antitoxin [Actinomycetaceae bacterium]